MSTTPAAQQLQQVLERFHAGDFDAAAILLDRLLSVSADHPDLLHLGAMISLRRQRFDLAENFALRAAGTQPDNAAFRYTRAQALSALQRDDEALAELRHALRLDPGMHKAHVRLWEILSAREGFAGLTGLLKQRLALLDTRRPAEPAATRVRIPDTTLCCIDCSNHAPAIRALQLSMAGCEFPRALFFTDRDFDLKPIETVRIEPIRSLQDYSKFVIKDLLRHVDTEYVLIIQWDGYVVNPALWSDQFLLFDYVGARWPHELLNIPAAHAVGNGGFSLRSRTLLEALQDPQIVASHPEDTAICRTHREYLEREHGIAFAPATVADQFSFEHVEPRGPTFGFHGQINITRFVDDEAIRLLELR
ncbi:MAG: hypothetical protein K8S22_16615 [Betaproteobacteria bacterium]|nr:hypothetical protein [Betaproteobacteria bacterium]